MLPIALAVGGLLIFRTGIQPSLSAYYYTGMKNVFVGTLCAIGVFLFSYRGYSKKDNIAANIAAFCAIGTALFPTALAENATAIAEIIGKPVFWLEAIAIIAFGISWFVKGEGILEDENRLAYTR